MTSPAPDPSPATAAPKICFNTLCLGPRSPPPQRKGWRLRSGDLADLCDACFSSYEKGIFCENFHSDIAGWRNCESCRKRMHCGCIISAPTYILRDTGGVDCVPCARKVLSMTPKQMMSSSLLLPQQASERLKDFPPKGHNQRTSPYAGQQRRQAANMWNVSGAPSELQQRLAYEFDRPNAEKLMSGLRSSASLQEKRIERYANGNTLDSITSLNNTNSEVGKRNTFLDSGQLVGENDSMFTRKGLIPTPHLTKSGNNFGSHPNSSSMLKDCTTPRDGFAAPISTPHDTFDPTRASTTQEHGQIAPQLRKQLCPAPHDIIDPCEELQAHMPNGRPRADFVSRARAQLLPRYWPRLTNQELQQISGDSNSVITPLFEKMLSASDAGRIGRLVLPKKCAEAYFPQINQPEGLPLKVQDATGKEWVFQFRFWPNNNSRMYVLEGVTPCIQSMQLQAGDTVTFSRIGSEGKLIMGFRKASSISGELDIQRVKAGSGFATPIDITDKSASTEFIPNHLNRPSTSSTEVRDEINIDERSLSKVVRAGFIQKNGSGPVAKSSLASSKRKGSILGSKSKRLRIIHKDSIQLKLSWEAAQDLLRPPPNNAPSIVIIDGHEFEEYEEAPVIGMPTIFTTNQTGDKSQWAQCEECSKWRRLPENALLPSRWTCSDNTWDLERSSCSSAEEPSVNQLAQFLPIQPGTSKRPKINEERDDVKAANGLDTLANLAILGEGNDLPSTSSQATTKHPRHRPGCTCIVCIQPPSGKGPKHKPNCTCNVCLTVKRRFRTLMLRKEQRQSEKEAESCALKQQQQQQQQQPIRWLEMSPVIAGDSPLTSSPPQNFGANNDEAEQKKASPPPLKACIDLNLQPEREEELSAT